MFGHHSMWAIAYKLSEGYTLIQSKIATLNISPSAWRTAFSRVAASLLYRKCQLESSCVAVLRMGLAFQNFGFYYENLIQTTKNRPSFISFCLQLVSTACSHSLIQIKSWEGHGLVYLRMVHHWQKTHPKGLLYKFLATVIINFQDVKRYQKWFSPCMAEAAMI